MPRLFVTVLEGETPATATPIIATEDRRVVRAIVKELNQRLGPRAKSPRLVKFDRQDEIVDEQD